MRPFLFFLFTIMLSLPVMAFETDKKVIAHRGLSSSHPENTMIAFREAVFTKAEYIELDVHLSQDNIPMVIHDEELERTTSGHGKVGMYPMFALKQLLAGYTDKFGKKFLKEKIPTLKEVMDYIMKESDKYLLIEIKHHEEDEYNKRIGRVVYESVMKDFSEYKHRFAFISFGIPILDDIYEIDQTVTLGPILSRHPKKGSLADQAIRLGSDIVIFSKRIAKNEKIFTQTDRVKHFIYTIDPSEFKKYSRYEGLYGFATNHADHIE